MEDSLYHIVLHIVKEQSRRHSLHHPCTWTDPECSKEDEENSKENSKGSGKTEKGQRVKEGRERGRCPSLEGNDVRPLKVLGKGRFGTVSLVRHVPSDRLFARKELGLSTNEHRRRAIRELAFLRVATHPRIVALHAAKTQSCLYLYLEYMVGGSLSDLIQQGRASTPCLPFPLIHKYVHHIISAVAFLHSKHIVHRDIKPSNVLRDGNGNAKLADFGSACREGERVPFNGTALYAAPESLSKDQVDSRSDIWSIGTTLLEMVSGRLPWHDEPSIAFYLTSMDTLTLNLPPTTPSIKYLIDNTLLIQIEQRLNIRTYLHKAQINN